MFKVVPDQLRISEGWARCGQCGEIFDASQHLIADAAVEAAAPTGGDAGARPDAGGPLSQDAAAPVAARETVSADAPAPAIPHEVQHAAASAPLLGSGTEDGPAQPAVPDEPQSAEHAPADTVPPAVAPVLPPPAVAVVSSPEFEPTQAEEKAPEVSFMRDGKKDSIWRRPAVRITLLLLVLLLVAVLAAQFLVHERDRIASMEPSTRPLLTVLCAWSGCKLGPVRQIESIVIDSSSFSRVRGENYRLAFSLKNNAALDLAMPAIELALTDTQDQAVVRRVIAPAEFGAATRLLAAGSDWSSSLSLSVKPVPNGERIAGYRLLAFYP